MQIKHKQYYRYEIGTKLQKAKKTGRFQLFGRLLAVLAVVISSYGFIASTPLPASNKVADINSMAFKNSLEIVTPAAGSYQNGLVTLRSRLADRSLNDYDMFWYLGYGNWHWMGNANNGNFKNTDIDVSGWKWQAPLDLYTIRFVAVIKSGPDAGQQIHSELPIHVGTTSAASAPPAAPAVQIPATPAVAAPTPAPAIPQVPVTAVRDIQRSADLYVRPGTQAALVAQTSSDPAVKRIMSRLSATPTATWFGNWNKNIRADAAALVASAQAAGTQPVIVAYNIPNRDCSGNYSAGGSVNSDSYLQWVRELAGGIGQSRSIVILEPDALPDAGCLSNSAKSERYRLIADAVSILKAGQGTKVYIDAGNSGWVSATDIAGRLNAAGIAAADGFSLNVSGFVTTATSTAYGRQVSALVGGKHFVVDTSRNGNGPLQDAGVAEPWCNPPGRAFGKAPTTDTGDNSADYFLWIKNPGESDGPCKGGPSAGQWWTDYAIGLGVHAGW